MLVLPIACRTSGAKVSVGECVCVFVYVCVPCWLVLRIALCSSCAAASGGGGEGEGKGVDRLSALASWLAAAADDAAEDGFSLAGCCRCLVL